MDLEDGAAFVVVGEIDEEEFIEAAAAEEFRGEAGDVIGRCDDEDGRGVFLEPGEEASDDAGDGGIGGGFGVEAGEGLVDFFEPQDGRCDCLHGVEDFAEVLLGGAAGRFEEGREIHADQRKPEQPRDGLGAQAFSAALNARQEDALGIGDSA